VPAIVLIGPTDVLVALREHLAADDEVHTFTDHQIREAVEHIAVAKPAVIAIDEEFAVSPRGEALVGRITDDPSLSGCQIRVLPRAQTPERIVTVSPVAAVRAAEPASAQSAAVVVAPALDRGTRRAPRVRMSDGIAVTVDGNPAELIDLSTIGAQVVSRIVLRPNQRVRVALPEGKRALRCAGSVVWASFEMPPGQPPRYRAGLRLTGADGEALQGFAERHRAAGLDQPD
jgi:hypothetical protein